MFKEYKGFFHFTKLTNVILLTSFQQISECVIWGPDFIWEHIFLQSVPLIYSSVTVPVVYGNISFLPNRQSEMKLWENYQQQSACDKTKQLRLECKQEGITNAQMISQFIIREREHTKLPEKSFEKRSVGANEMQLKNCAIFTRGDKSRRTGSSSNLRL